jgi:hypothetical protein
MDYESRGEQSAKCERPEVMPASVCDPLDFGGSSLLFYDPTKSKVVSLERLLELANFCGANLKSLFSTQPFDVAPLAAPR